MADEYTDYLETLTPEQLELMFKLSTITDQNAMLDEQIAQATALQRPSGQQHSTGKGAALGGIGDVLRQIAGQRDAAKYRDERGANLNTKREALKTMAESRRRGRYGPQDYDENGLLRTPDVPEISDEADALSAFGPYSGGYRGGY